MTSIRLPISFFLSVLTTVALFWFLGMLTSRSEKLETVPVLPGINFSTLVPETETVHIVHVRPPIPKPKPTGVSPIVTEPNVVRMDNESKGVSPVKFGPGELAGPQGRGPEIAHAGGNDRAPVPQIRIEPDYPVQLKDRGIEGWVTFQFTVTANGSVKDVVILASDPPRVWDAATIRAVSNWKYQPATKDGRPVEQTGLRATYHFEIEK
jgi:protein TonB